MSDKSKPISLGDVTMGTLMILHDMHRQLELAGILDRSVSVDRLTHCMNALPEDHRAFLGTFIGGLERDVSGRPANRPHLSLVETPDAED
ncbi:hypothetical protein ACSD7O_24750 [Methylorubrum extorquens]|uniref:hypothetical protein n=1 Tax=Methylorubrum extorquens TaxID=408 RepID=UPI003F5DE85A